MLDGNVERNNSRLHQDNNNSATAHFDRNCQVLFKLEASAC
jgi:hypothetical protein